jgi:hypothetical protein
MFLSTTKFGRTKQDEDQKPYPVLPHQSSPYLVYFLSGAERKLLRTRTARADGARSHQIIAVCGLDGIVLTETLS